MNRTRYIVTADTVSFEHWCQSHGIPLLDDSVRYVRSAKQLKSLDVSDVVLAKGWQARADWRDIYNEILRMTGRSA